MLGYNIRIVKIQKTASQLSLKMASDLSEGDDVCFADLMTCVGMVTESTLLAFMNQGHFDQKEVEIILDKVKETILKSISKRIENERKDTWKITKE